MKKIAAALICAAFLTACAESTDNAAAGEPVSETEAYALGDSFSETESEITTETTVTTVTTEASSETTETSADLEFEDNARNAYEHLLMFFDTVYDGAYPDDYGGAYSYAGTLFVNITENDPPESYTDVLGDYTCVRYETVEHSFNRLTEISLEAKELLDSEFGVEEWFVDVPDNTAAVTIRNEDPKKAQNFLKTVDDKSFTLDELSISMADSEE